MQSRTESLLEYARRLAGVIQDWRRNSDGVAAIEFAIIAPILITMLFGLFEACRAYSAHRKFLNVSNTIGDLVSREKEVDNTALVNVYKVAPTVMGGFSSGTADLSITIMPIKLDGSKARMYATPQRFDKTVPACSTDVTIATDIMDLLKNSTQGLVVVDTTYVYKPLFASQVIGTMTWTSRTTFAPRVQCVGFGATGNLKTCTSTC